MDSSLREVKTGLNSYTPIVFHEMLLHHGKKK